MRFIVTGGGTGGHIYPALAIARGLKDRFEADVFYIGGTRGLENEIVPREGLPFQAIPLSGFKRSLSLSNLMVLWKAIVGIKKAYRLIKEIAPAAVIGTGGYVCGPVVLAAALSGIPTLIHEQNAFPGVTTRILARVSRCVALTFAEAGKYLPSKATVKVTGLPVRKEIAAANRDQSREKLGLPGDRLVILSFGGSQGARSINNAMLSVLKHYIGRPDLHFVHVTGISNYQSFVEALAQGISEPNSGNITITSYMHDMPSALAAADVIIARAGAATLAEITTRGLPSILIPYPHAAENHQEHNARALEGKKAARVIQDRELTGDRLISELDKLIGNRMNLQEMAKSSKEMGKPQALDDILDCVKVLLDNNDA